MLKHTSKSIFHRRPKGRLLSLALLMAMLLTQAASAASSETLPNSMQSLEPSRAMDLDTAKNGVVRVMAGFEGENGKPEYKSSANGFIVGMDGSDVRVITVLHAVDLGEDSKIWIVVKNDTVVEASVDSSVMSKEKDFCLLRAENMFNDKNMLSLRVPVYDAEEEKLASGDDVTALGFASGVGSSSGFTSADVTAASGTLSKAAGENAGFLETGIAPFDGVDGSPLVDKDGYVVGLVNSKIKGAEGVISAIDISSIEALLDSGDYAFRTKDKDLMYNELYELCADGEKEFKSASGSSRNAIQRAWKNAVEVMGSASYSRSALSTALTDYKDAVDSAHKKVPRILPVMTAILGAVIIGLLIRLISLLRWNKANSGGAAKPPKEEKKKTARRQKRRKAPQRVETAMPVSPQRAVLISPVTGAEYPIGGGAVTLGRSDSCDIQLPSRKVSQRHASIRSAGGSFLLFDMGSTNGTYLNNVPVGGGGAALTPGDIIRLADVELQFIQR